LEVFVGGLSLERCDSLLQDLVVASLATTSGAHYHETVTHLARVVKLNDLQVKLFNILQVLDLALIVDCLNETLIFLLGSLDAWEQIENNVLEERQVILEELWHVDVS